MSYALSIARRHGSKVLITHVVNSQAERTITDGCRAGQAEVTEHFVRNRLDGVDHELLVSSGEVWPVLEEMISERTSYRIINLIVGLQVMTIIASSGNVYVLGEAYAFGLMVLSELRFQQPLDAGPALQV